MLGLGDRPRRIIDEAVLQQAPSFAESGGFLRLQGDDIEPLDALFPRHEVRFALAAAAEFAHGAVVFRTEALVELFRLPCSYVQPDSRRSQYHGHGDREHQPRSTVDCSQHLHIHTSMTSIGLDRIYPGPGERVVQCWTLLKRILGAAARRNHAAASLP